MKNYFVATVQPLFLRVLCGITVAMLSLYAGGQQHGQTYYVGPPILPSWTTWQCHQWSRTFGEWNHERLNTMQPTADGGFILAGQHTSTQDNIVRPWVVKTDADGNTIWQRTYGSGIYSTEPRSVQQTTDGGYIFAGYTETANREKDFWIVKTAAAGTMQWQKTVGGSGRDEAYSIALTNDGGYIVCGTTASDDGDVTGGAGGGYNYWIVKLDNAGDLVWQKKLEASQRPYSIKQTTDGGYIIAGDSPTYYNQTANPDDPSDEGAFCVLKLNASGNFQWQLSLGTYKLDAAYDIILTNDGNYVAAGFTTNQKPDGDDWDGLAVKISPAGALLWQARIDHSWHDEIKSIRQTADGGFAYAGFADWPWNNSYTTYDPSDYWVGKLDAAGQLVWQGAFGGRYEGSAEAIVPVADGGYVVAGSIVIPEDIGQGIAANLDYALYKLTPGCIMQQVSGHYKARRTVPACCGHSRAAGASTQNRSVTASQANNATGEEVFFRDSLDRLIATVTSGGASPVSGDVTATVWVDRNQSPTYLRRHYEITPDENAATATANIKLYFSQEDFNAYNLLVSADRKLPTGPSDAAGKANFRIVKYSGASSNDSGLPGAYTGGSTVITPADDSIVWKNNEQIWEVSFAVTGFSGFFATDALTADAPLPVTFGAISAFIKDGLLTVNWTAESETNNAWYIIEAATDGKNFTAISDKILSKAQDGNSSAALQYRFTKSYSLLQGMAIVCFVLTIGFSRKSRKTAICMAAISCFVFALSCTKTNTAIENSGNKKLFIRIVQVDKDGSKSYSKTIIALNNG